MKKIHLVTSNKGKLKTFQDMVDDSVQFEMACTDALGIIEPQSSDIAEISLSKAKQAHAKLGGMVVVEDSGLFLNAYPGFPGAYSKDALQSLGCEGFHNLMMNTEDKSCHFYGVVTVIDEDGSVYVFDDEPFEGEYRLEPSAPSADQWGFLWQHFYIPAFSKTLAEMTEEERHQYRFNKNSRFGKVAEFLTAKC